MFKAFIFRYRVRECSNFIDLCAGSFLYPLFLCQVLPLFSSVSSVFAITL